MGFSGGGSNVLKNHKHDGTVVQDGGSLDADNVTSADLTAGDIIYSNGTHLQRVAIGNPADVLTVSAGNLPSWVAPAGGGGAIELVDHTELSGSATEINTTFTAIDGNDIACLLVYVNAVPDGGNDVQCQIGSNGVLRNSNYYVEGAKIAGATQTLIDLNAAASFRVSPHEGANKAQTSVINVFVGDSTMASTLSQIINYMVSGHSDAGASTWENGSQTTAGSTTLTSVRIFVNAGNLLAGSSLSIYRVNKA
tara:strand:+ start:1024 stop:1779 length:756 start_codon:yes stop_codon:yes gene_type:complete